MNVKPTIIPLEKVASILGGFAYKSSWFHDTGMVLIRIGDISDGEVTGAHCVRVRPENIPDTNLVRAETGDILMALSGATTGKTGIVPASLAGSLVNQRVAIIRPADASTGKLISTYLSNSRVRSNLLKLAGGSAQPNLSPNVLKSFLIPLPPSSQRQKVAEILDKADAIRRKRRQAIDLMNDFLRSVFLEMFGDPVTNPLGWKSLPLEELAKVVSGVTKGRKLDSSMLISVPYMRVANVQDGFINISEVKEIDVLPSDVDKYSLKSGDVLLTEGGDPDKLGRGAVWYNQVEKCIHQNHIFRVRVLEKAGIDPEYLSALIGSEYGKRYFLRAAKQTTGIATINSRQLKALPVLLPPLSLQQRFDLVVRKVRALLKTIDKASDSAEQLFQSTSNELFSRQFQERLI